MINYILTLNSWSSSIKISIYKYLGEKKILDCKIKNINSENWKIEINYTNKKWNKKNININFNKKISHKDWLWFFINYLYKIEEFEIKNIKNISLISHRVVHWWEYFNKPILVTNNNIEKIKNITELAPLHNKINLMWILFFEKNFPNIKQVIVFDTWFHQTIKKENYIYAIPEKYTKKYNIRKYWFHWISHKYVFETLKIYLSKKNIYKKKSKVISCHIWNWSSITAIKWWKSIDNSMWFTPLEWIIMGTRSWSIDPWIIVYLQEKENLSYNDINNLLNKQSWILWLYWTNDLKTITEKYIIWEEKAKLVINIFINSIIKQIWSYIALLNWVDYIIFTWWVLEWKEDTQILLRKLIMKKLSNLWIKICDRRNKIINKDINDISKKSSEIKVYVIPTNEELMLAREWFKFIK